MAEWYVYALLTMLFFSFANIILKALLTEEFVSTFQKNSSILLPSLAILILAILAIYFLFIANLNLPQTTMLMTLGFILLASLGFVSLLVSVSAGKIAPVTAIVSTSSLMVAILSVLVLKESLTLREVSGILLAFFGIVLLVTK